MHDSNTVKTHYTVLGNFRRPKWLPPPLCCSTKTGVHPHMSWCIDTAACGFLCCSSKTKAHQFGTHCAAASKAGVRALTPHYKGCIRVVLTVLQHQQGLEHLPQLVPRRACCLGHWWNRHQFSWSWCTLSCPPPAGTCDGKWVNYWPKFCVQLCLKYCLMQVHHQERRNRVKPKLCRGFDIPE